MLPSDTTNHSTLLKCRPRSQMICCCITVHSYHELLETNVYVIASSAAIAKISQPQGPPVTYR